jgi:hypothetical protein
MAAKRLPVMQSVLAEITAIATRGRIGPNSDNIGAALR